MELALYKTTNPKNCVNVLPGIAAIPIIGLIVSKTIPKIIRKAIRRNRFRLRWAHNEACALSRIACLYERQEHPASQHRGAAARHKRERYAGKRQDIDRAEHVERDLHHEHARRRAGSYRIVRAAAVTGVAHGKKRKCEYGEHSADGDDEPELLAHNAEHRVRISGKGILEPAVARALSEKSAGCSGRERMGLLIAAVPNVLGVPDMTPGCKSARHMVLHFKHQEPCHACTRYRKCNSRYRARAHEGYHEEGHEEYQRRSEIAAEGKAYDAQCRKHNKQNKVLRTEQSVKRGGADIDERNLYKFRGLYLFTAVGNTRGCEIEFHSSVFLLQFV